MGCTDSKEKVALVSSGPGGKSGPGGGRTRDARGNAASGNGTDSKSKPGGGRGERDRDGKRRGGNSGRDRDADNRDRKERGDRKDRKDRRGDGTGKRRDKSGKRSRPRGKVLEEDYTLGKLLGRGHYGWVYEGVRKRGGEHVAIKMIDRSRSRKERLALEVDILTTIGSHPHCVCLYDVYETDKHVQLVMEMMSGGELFDRIIQAGPLKESKAANVTQQLAQALRFLHRKGIVHRDLKPENILLTDKSSDFDVKIADFGLSKLRDESDVMKTVCGTWAYSAPEVRMDQRGYNHKVDLWSLGVILYVVIAGYHPFDPSGDAPEHKLQRAIRRGKFDFDDPVWSKVSDLCKDLIKSLIRVNPEERLDTNEVLLHPWVKQNASSRGRSGRSPRRVRSGRSGSWGSQGSSRINSGGESTGSMYSSVTSRGKGASEDTETGGGGGAVDTKSRRVTTRGGVTTPASSVANTPRSARSSGGAASLGSGSEGFASVHGGRGSFHGSIGSRGSGLRVGSNPDVTAFERSPSIRSGRSGRSGRGAGDRADSRQSRSKGGGSRHSSRHRGDRSDRGSHGGRRNESHESRSSRSKGPGGSRSSRSTRHRSSRRRTSDKRSSHPSRKSGGSNNSSHAGPSELPGAASWRVARTKVDGGAAVSAGVVMDPKAARDKGQTVTSTSTEASGTTEASSGAGTSVPDPTAKAAAGDDATAPTAGGESVKHTDHSAGAGRAERDGAGDGAGGGDGDGDGNGAGADAGADAGAGDGDGAGAGDGEDGGGDGADGDTEADGSDGDGDGDDAAEGGGATWLDRMKSGEIMSDGEDDDATDVRVDPLSRFKSGEVIEDEGEYDVLDSDSPTRMQSGLLAQMQSGEEMEGHMSETDDEGERATPRLLTGAMADLESGELIDEQHESGSEDESPAPRLTGAMRDMESGEMLSDELEEDSDGEPESKPLTGAMREMESGELLEDEVGSDAEMEDPAQKPGGYSRAGAGAVGSSRHMVNAMDSDEVFTEELGGLEMGGEMLGSGHADSSEEVFGLARPGAAGAGSGDAALLSKMESNEIFEGAVDVAAHTDPTTQYNAYSRAGAHLQTLATSTAQASSYDVMGVADAERRALNLQSLPSDEVIEADVVRLPPRKHDEKRRATKAARKAAKAAKAAKLFAEAGAGAGAMPLAE